jgi:hypothetical protein
MSGYMPGHGYVTDAQIAKMYKVIKECKRVPVPVEYLLHFELKKSSRLKRAKKTLERKIREAMDYLIWGQKK